MRKVEIGAIFFYMGTLGRLSRTLRGWQCPINCPWKTRGIPTADPWVTYGTELELTGEPWASTVNPWAAHARFMGQRLSWGDAWAYTQTINP